VKNIQKFFIFKFDASINENSGTSANKVEIAIYIEQIKYKFGVRVSIFANRGRMIDF